MFLLDSRIFFFKILESLFFLEISLSPRVSILSFLCLCLSKRELCLKKKERTAYSKKKSVCRYLQKKKKKESQVWNCDCLCILKRLGLCCVRERFMFGSFKVSKSSSSILVLEYFRVFERLSEKLSGKRHEW